MRSAAVLLVCLCAATACPAAEWKTVKSTHFVVSYRNAPVDFAERVSDEAERCYERITSELGFLRYNFWLWDNRAQIYVYDNEQEFQSVLGVPTWSAGAALPRDKAVYAYYGREGFFERILPHEIGHIIFREFVGFDNYAVPLWLDEGAASYQEKSGMARQVLAGFVSQTGRLIPLDQLSSLNPHLTKDQATVELFYAEAVSVIGFLIQNFGRDSFVLFCRALRDTGNFDKALSYAYQIRGIEELDRRWRKDLE